MDLYTTILNKGGQFLQDGSVWRDIISKDGSKIIRQIAQKNGTSAIDIYEKSNGQLIQCFRKTIKPDGQSYITKSFNYAKNCGLIQSVLKFKDKSSSFMQTLFKTNETGKIRPTGDFFSVAEKQIKKGKVTYFPIGNKISSNSGLNLYTEVFNKNFGQQESSVF